MEPVNHVITCILRVQEPSSYPIRPARGFIRNVCGHVSWYHLHCAPKMHAGGNADPRKDANANAIMPRAEWDANAWGALPETAPPLASSYGWRNLYVRIPSAICGSLDCIAG